MNKKEFVDLILKESIENKELENKVVQQDYVFVRKGLKKYKVNLIGIDVYPYGKFSVGNWNGRAFIHQEDLLWKDYGKTWALTKEELL